MQKVRQNDLKFSENQFVVFEILTYFFVKVSSNFFIQDPHLHFLINVPQKTAKLSKKQNCRNFDAFGDFAQI